MCCARCALFRGVLILSASFMHTAICISSSYCDIVTICYLCYFSFCPRHVHVRSSRQHPLPPHPTAAAAPDALAIISCLDFISSTHPFADSANRRSAAPCANTAAPAITQNVHCLVIWRVTVKYSARGVGERWSVLSLENNSPKTSEICDNSRTASSGNRRPVKISENQHGSKRGRQWTSRYFGVSGNADPLGLDRF